MSEYKSIDYVLKSTLDSTSLPVYKSVYPGDKEENPDPTEYLVFNYGTEPVLYGDDEPEYDIYLVQVHLFAKLNINISARIKQIKSLLVEAGFEYPSTVDASDTEWRHIVFETQASDGTVMDYEPDEG